MNGLNYQPTWNRVLVEKEEPPEKLGSFWVPDVSKLEPFIARVIAVGPGYFDEEGNHVPMTVKPGDRILMNRWAGYQVTLDGKVYYWIYQFADNRTDIWGIVPEGMSVEAIFPKQSQVDRYDRYQSVM